MWDYPKGSPGTYKIYAIPADNFNIFKKLINLLTC